MHRPQRESGATYPVRQSGAIERDALACIDLVLNSSICRVGPAAAADEAGGRTVHSQAHAQSFRRGAVRPMGGEPVLPSEARSCSATSALRSFTAGASGWARSTSPRCCRKAFRCRTAPVRSRSKISSGWPQTPPCRRRRSRIPATPAHAPRRREAGRASQARGCRAAGELFAARQARRHHGGALHACAPVQARPAPTQIPAHAARPHHS